MNIDEQAREAAKAAKPIFDMHGWTWFEDTEPPSESRLYIWIYDLLREAIDRDALNVSSGRITVARRDVGKYDVLVQLELGAE